MNATNLRHARVALVAVAIAWVVAQVALVGVHRWFAWDEAVYFAKASPDLPTVSWAAARSLGFPALLWPVVAAGGGAGAVRVEMLLVCGAGLVAAYWPWTTRLGGGGVAAAVLFAGSWPALFYGTELYPNLVVALALVGALGAAVNAQTKRAAVVALAFMAIASTCRPTDALLAAVGAAPLLFVVRRRQAITPVTGLLGGVAVGWTVWVVEAFLDFGGPIERFRTAFQNNAARDPRRGVLTGLAHQPLTASLSRSPIVAALAWVAFLAALAIAGYVIAHRRGELSVLVALAAAAMLLIAYVLYAPDTGARFLLPVFALISVPAGIALDAARRALAHPASARGVLAGAVCALVAVTIVLHGHAANAIATRERAARATDQAAGRELARLAHGRPCAFVSQFNYPAIEVASHCNGAPLRFDRSPSLPRSFTRQPGLRFAVGPFPPAAGSRVAQWRRVQPVGAPGVSIYVAPVARPKDPTGG
ncbi:MAG: hypothetical protein JWL83_3886 [Actinomycetia bacterium]|nr:hypothetical protein [Actinomycetes bacterium]